MNYVGIPRKIDGLGRLVLPKELRQLYNLETGSYVELIPTENGFLIQREVNKSVFQDLKKGE